MWTQWPVLCSHGYPVLHILATPVAVLSLYCSTARLLLKLLQPVNKPRILGFRTEFFLLNLLETEKNLFLSNQPFYQNEIPIVLVLALYEDNTSGSFGYFFIVFLCCVCIYRLFIGLYTYSSPGAVAFMATYTWLHWLLWIMDICIIYNIFGDCIWMCLSTIICYTYDL